MAELSVVIIAADPEQRTILQTMVDATSIARTALASPSYPSSVSDPLVRRLQTMKPGVVLIDVPHDNGIPALRALEILQESLPASTLFAIGNMSHPQIIVGAMRAGAKEFLERPTTTTDLLEAFIRLTNSQKKTVNDDVRGKVFVAVNAKAGSGSTTLAVNLALALQQSQGATALVDLAPLGHAALHLSLKPAFTVADAIQNLHRLDRSLLESFMVRHESGLHLLAGPDTPSSTELSNTDFARLFDMLSGQFRYVVVDASSRLDATTRLICNMAQNVLLVAQSDVTSLWSAARVQQYLAETGGQERIGLVLSRYKKIAGFSEADAEAAAGARLVWKIPNQFQSFSNAIDRGVPLVRQGGGEFARSFNDLAAKLTENDVEVKRTAWSLFKSV